VTEVSNPLYGSLSLAGKSSLQKQCIALQKIFQTFFGEIADISKNDIVTATHQARKALKSYRGFVKLLKNCNGIKDYKGANYLLRDLGKEFSEMRDSHVRSMLMEELNRPLQSQLLQNLIEQNNQEKENKESILLSTPNHFDVLSSTILESSLLNHLLSDADIQKSCLDAGLESTFQKSARAFSSCSDIQSEDLFHEWRKRLKDLLNQIKLFLPEQDLLSDERFTQIDGLCEDMGSLNDMAMLKQWIEETTATTNETDDYSGILNFLDNKITVFQKRLLSQGDVFYKEPQKTMNQLESMISDE
jgi:CHAD domain-containing protein